MLKIRFNRVGRRNHVQYRVVVQEHTSAPGGRHVAVVGSYDPHTKEATLKKDEIQEYLKNGAQASDSVHNLLVSQEVISDKKRAVKVPEKKTEEGAEEESAKKEESKEEAKGDAEQPEKEEEKKDAPAEEKKEEVKKEDAPKKPARTAGGEEKKEEPKKEESKKEGKEKEKK